MIGSLILNKFGTESCLHCGCYNLFSNSGFCSYCFEKLRQQYFHDQLKPYTNVISLINWVPNKSDAISNLITILKEHRHPEYIEFYSALLAKLIVTNPEFTGPCLLIPIPGSTKTRNLSLLLANKISQIISTECCDVLVRTEISQTPSYTLEQKRKSKLARKQIQYTLDEKFTDKVDIDLSKTTVLLIDDVITTGSSMLAAQKTLSNARKMIGITLAYRAQLANSYW